MNALELFPCSGGMAEGFRRAGIEFEMAFDFDTDACDSYEKNLGHRPIQIDVRDLLRMIAAGWRPLGQVDFLCADPPCTPWSRAGKRQGLDDERDMLHVTTALIECLQPTCWLIGNVPGLDDSTNVGAVQKTIGRLTRGYCVDYARLDAAHYGVPQHRVRPFWFGHRWSTPCIRWPLSTHGDPRLIGHEVMGDARVPWITCRDALGHLPPDQLGKPIRLRWHAETDHAPNDPDAPARTLTGHAYSDGALLTNQRHPISRSDEPSYTITTKGDGRGAQGACVVDWSWDRPSTTITADERIAPPGHHGKSFLSPAEIDRPSTTVTCRDEVGRPGRNGRAGTSQSTNAIKLSERAAAILQGFPESWVFSGATKKARWGQIGMAMPPPLAAAVATSIKRWFDERAREQAA